MNYQAIGTYIRISTLSIALLIVTACNNGNSENNDGTITSTGYLIDSPVSGVSYNTATQSGITGDDGDFLYQIGEIVTFSLGDTILGRSKGQTQLSLFNLVSNATPITGNKALNEALYEEKNQPFHSVINLATLLQTFDDDGNPDNGIKISTPVAGLFADISIDFEQTIDKIQHDTDFRTTLNKTNTQTLLLSYRSVKKPLYGVDHLYNTLGINPQLYARTRYEWDNDADGATDRIDIHQYDADGNQTRYESDTNADGTANYISTFRYDGNGNLTRYEEDRDADGIAESIDTFQYDADGNRIRYQEDKNADGTAETITTYQYDATGKQTSYERDNNADGAIDKIVTKTYSPVKWAYLTNQ